MSEIVRLSEDTIPRDLLLNFQHDQIIARKFVKQGDAWIITESGEIRTWDQDKRVGQHGRIFAGQDGRIREFYHAFRGRSMEKKRNWKPFVSGNREMRQREGSKETLPVRDSGG